MVSELEPGLRTYFLKASDFVFRQGLYVIGAIIPDFEKYSLSEYVANGFNISGNTMVQCFLQAGAFMVPVFIASYICFKMREVAK